MGRAMRAVGLSRGTGTGGHVAHQGWTGLSITQRCLCMGWGSGRCWWDNSSVRISEEMSSTLCGGVGFTLNHHTPVNFALKINLWIIFALFALLHFFIVDVSPWAYFILWRWREEDEEQGIKGRERKGFSFYLTPLIKSLLDTFLFGLPSVDQEHCLWKTQRKPSNCWLQARLREACSSCSRAKCPCSWQGAWNEVILKVPANPSLAEILWLWVLVLLLEKWPLFQFIVGGKYSVHFSTTLWMLPNLCFVNKNEFKFLLGYRDWLYHAGSLENTGFGGVTSYQCTQFSPYLLSVCPGEGLGTLLGCPDSGWPLLVRVTDWWPQCGCSEGKAEFIVTPVSSLFLYLKVSVQDSKLLLTPRSFFFPLCILSVCNLLLGNRI